MFEQATLSNPNASRRAWTTGLGVAGEAVFVAFIVVAPMLWPAALPKPQALLMLLTPPAPVPPHTDVRVRPRTLRTISARPLFTMPTSIPAKPALIEDVAPAVEGAVPDVGQSAAGQPGNGLLTQLLAGSTLPSAPRPAIARATEPKPATETTAVPKRIRTSSLELARVIHRVEPIYPTIAKVAHVSGAVELTGIIGTDGHIRELKALSGSPLLIRAAIDAVSQWIYAPPVLNGERVEVIAPITVNFRLDR